jgi:hypothetical protein
MADGKEINVNHNFNLVATMNPFANAHGHYNEPDLTAVSLPYPHKSSIIPVHFRSSFRVVSLMEPDVELILRAKCILCGIKAPSIVACRLKTLYDLCCSSLMSLRSKYQLTVSSFMAVIETIYGKSRAETAMDSRPTSFTVQSNVGSASNNKYSSTKIECELHNFISNRPFFFQINIIKMFDCFKVLSTQTLPVREVAKKSRIALVNYARNEHAQIGQALLDMITPRLESDVCRPLFF